MAQIDEIRLMFGRHPEQLQSIEELKEHRNDYLNLFRMNGTRELVILPESL